VGISDDIYLRMMTDSKAKRRIEGDYALFVSLQVFNNDATRPVTISVSNFARSLFKTI